MATYDFRCKACDTEFEITRSMGSTDDVSCPECGCEATRVFTPVGVAFKGTGFHNTDYRPKPPSEAPSCPAADSGSCAGCASAGD
ncbi:MAG: FmdB family transcriptional regulator [Coriobacteriia bacterium]|nr:FmdB family transcriptional regulator [Coriobacteriia bacterium]